MPTEHTSPRFTDDGEINWSHSRDGSETLAQSYAFLKRMYIEDEGEESYEKNRAFIDAQFKEMVADGLVPIGDLTEEQLEGL